MAWKSTSTEIFRDNMLMYIIKIVREKQKYVQSSYVSRDAWPTQMKSLSMDSLLAWSALGPVV